MKVEAIEHTDIRGKKQLYLKITETGKEPVVINIGLKTFEAVRKLLGEPTKEKAAK
jgi:hypothetical protein